MIHIIEEGTKMEKYSCDIHENAGVKNVPATFMVGYVVRVCSSCKNKYLKLQEQGKSDPEVIQNIIARRMRKRGN